MPVQILFLKAELLKGVASDFLQRQICTPHLLGAFSSYLGVDSLTAFWLLQFEKEENQ